jgi:hypothetical protein
VTITGVLVHEKRTREEDFAVEAMDNVGEFETGKSLRSKTSHTTSGEGLDTMALPVVGSGAGTSASPHIDSTEQNEKNEGATDWTVEDHYYDAGQGDWA